MQTFTFGLVGKEHCLITVPASDEEASLARTIIHQKGGDYTKTLRGLVMKNARARMGFTPLFPVE